MIIFLHHPHGQTANHLLLHTTFRAACITRRCQLLNGKLSLIDRKFAFSRPTRRWIAHRMAEKMLCRYFRIMRPAPRQRRLFPGVRYIYNHVGSPYIDLDDNQQWNEIFRSSFAAVIQGFRFSATESVIRHADRLRQELNFDHVTQKRAAKTIDIHPSDVRIGIHVRRGDYEKYQGGQFFYQIEDYVRIMRSLVKQHPGRQCRFFVCSNERLQDEQFAGLNVHISRASPVDDMALLAACDLIVGPPSTFSLWSAWISRKRLLHIYDRLAPIVSADAAVPRNLDTLWATATRGRLRENIDVSTDG